MRWTLHNLLAHPLLVLCPPLGRWLHDRTAPAEAPDAVEPAGPAPVPLHLASPAPDPRVVALLEEALDKARAGELLGVGLVTVTTGRAIATCYEIGEGGVAGLVYALRCLERRLLDLGET